MTASECSAVDLKEYQGILLQYFRNMVTSTDVQPRRLRPNAESQEELIRQKRTFKTIKQDRHDVNQLDTSTNSDVQSSVKAKLEDKLHEFVSGKDEKQQNPFDVRDIVIEKDDYSDEEIEIMTKDTTGEMVQYIFSFMDIDSDRKVGSDELWEVSDGL